MRVVYFLFFLTLFISCEKKSEISQKKYVPYVISEERKKYEMQDELYEKGEIDKVVLMNLPNFFMEVRILF